MGGAADKDGESFHTPQPSSTTQVRPWGQLAITSHFMQSLPQPDSNI